jgi:hypothetical protein
MELLRMVVSGLELNVLLCSSWESTIFVKQPFYHETVIDLLHRANWIHQKSEYGR